MEHNFTEDPNAVWILLGLIVVGGLLLKLYFARTSKKLGRRGSRPSI